MKLHKLICKVGTMRKRKERLHNLFFITKGRNFLVYYLFFLSLLFSTNHMFLFCICPVTMNAADEEKNRERKKREVEKKKEGERLMLHSSTVPCAFVAFALKLMTLCYFFFGFFILLVLDSRNTVIVVCQL